MYLTEERQDGGDTGSQVFRGPGMDMCNVPFPGHSVRQAFTNPTEWVNLLEAFLLPQAEGDETHRPKKVTEEIYVLFVC